MEDFEKIEELYVEKILPLSYETIVKGCMDKDSKIYPFCDKFWFWKKKLEYDLNNFTLMDFFINSCKQGRLVYVNMLINIYNINPSDSNNEAIRLASLNGHVKIVELLIKDERVDPSDKNNYAIIWASEKGHVKIVELLLKDSRVDPSSFNNYAIRWASSNGHVKIVELLLKDERVDPSDRNNSAIIWASEKGHIKIVELLLKNERVKSKLSPKEIKFYESL